MKKPTLIVLMSLAFSCIFQLSYAQNQYTLSDQSKMVIKGTSSLHDWESDVSEMKADARMSIQSQTPQIQNLTLSVPVQSIKSGKSAMDKNTYEALKEKENPNIQFRLEDASCPNPGKIRAKGTLSIAGKTQPVTLNASYEVLSNGQLSLKGSHQMKMTDFGVDPPTAVFGTIKTGDEITIDYTLQLVKSN